MATGTVTATQSVHTFKGMLLRVFVITGASPKASQSGATAFTGQSAGTTIATQQAITPHAAGSYLFGVCNVQLAQSWAANATSFQYDQVQDATNLATYLTCAYGTSSAIAATPSTSAATIGWSTSSAIDFAFTAVEVLAAGTLAVNAAGPAVATTTSVTAVTTASFTPPAGSLLVALVASNTSTGASTLTLTDTLGGLNWGTAVAGGDDSPTYTVHSGIFFADVPGGGTNTSPVYAASQGAVAGGVGSWTNPGNATGAGDLAYATWTAP